MLMSSEFEAKLLGHVGRGHLPQIKFLKRTLGLHEEEASFSWSGGRQTSDEVEDSGNESDREQRTRCAGTAGPLRRRSPRTAVGMIGYIVLDRPDC